MILDLDTLTFQQLLMHFSITAATGWCWGSLALWFKRLFEEIQN